MATSFSSWLSAVGATNERAAGRYRTWALRRFSAISTEQANNTSFVFCFVGVTDIESIAVEKTLFGAEMDHAARQAACEQAVALASAVLAHGR
ncbi:hypothetical protein AB4Y32_35240 [Paraburkholderia phymatum]|uniref:Uncharacterized protein n=1 Tax=Paraburkholderia phymatum TaxID=148447 RepID=A0ACC6UBC1_9BURK